MRAFALSLLLALLVAPSWGQASKSFVEANDDRLTTTAGFTSPPYTYAGWVRVPTTSEAGAFLKFGNATGNPGAGTGIGVGNGQMDSPGNELLFLCEVVAWSDPNTTIGTGWVHVGLYDPGGAGTITRYLNGVSLGNGCAPRDPADEVYIGWSNTGTGLRDVNASLAHWALWNRALRDDEWRSLAGGASPQIYAPVRYWPLWGSGYVELSAGVAPTCTTCPDDSSDGPRVFIGGVE